MKTISQALLSLWQDKNIPEIILNLFLFFKENISTVRLAFPAFCKVVTKRVSLRANVTFDPNTFTKQFKIQALSSISHHIEHLIYFSHADATFSPPITHPVTGRDTSFLYTPNTSTAAITFGESDLRKTLTDQNPPLFHAASNVPSIINAMSQAGFTLWISGKMYIGNSKCFWTRSSGIWKSSMRIACCTREVWDGMDIYTETALIRQINDCFSHSRYVSCSNQPKLSVLNSTS